MSWTIQTERADTLDLIAERMKDDESLTYYPDGKVASR